METSVGASINRFVSYRPTDVDYLRGIVLFGQNSASYKFALAKSLLGLATDGTEFVSLPELAIPFSSAVCSHLAQAPRQGTSKSSKFLDTCRRFNEGGLTLEDLRDATVRFGFENVIDAFHVLGKAETPTRFFADERKGKTPGLRLTDSLLGLSGTLRNQSLLEVESRWRLVETAWGLGLNQALIVFDPEQTLLLANERRNPVTSARDALNGYQKGQCFYCFREISTIASHPELADVDHLIPHAMQRKQIVHGLDGIWNLVLACKTCNRGPGGKFDLMPKLTYLERLAQRNDFLISSHHPLRETLLRLTGQSASERTSFLQTIYDTAKQHNPSAWATVEVQSPRF